VPRSLDVYCIIEQQLLRPGLLNCRLHCAAMPSLRAALKALTSIKPGTDNPEQTFQN
jgi:hypothetical protein